MTHIAFEKNEYGTRISRLRCDACDREYTVCPASEDVVGKHFCQLPPRYDPNGIGCSSYAAAHDVDLMLENGGEIIKVPAPGQA